MVEAPETSSFLENMCISATIMVNMIEGKIYSILTNRWRSIANAQVISNVGLCIKVSLVLCITKAHDWRCHACVPNARRSADKKC